jgi:ABC-type multidrug transport system fused ATPase/permease subunit
MYKRFNFITGIILENKLAFAGFFVLSCLQSLLGLLVPYLSKLQIDQLENRYENIFNIFYFNPATVFILIISVGILFDLLGNMLSFASSVLRDGLDYKTSVRLEKELFDRIKRFDIGFMLNPRNRRIANSLMNSTYLINNLLNFSYNQIGLVVSIFGVLPIVAYFNFGIFAVLILSGLVQILLISYQSKQKMLTTVLRERCLSRLWQLQNLLFYQAHNIANADRSGFVFKKYYDAKNRNYEMERKEGYLYHKYSILDFILRNFSYFLAASYAGLQVIGGDMTIGSFVMILMYISILQSFFGKITETVSEFSSIRINLNKLDFFMNLKPRLNLDKIIKIKKLISGDIVFQNVSFSYPSFYAEEIDYIKSIIDSEESLKRKYSYMFSFEDLAEWKEIIVQGKEKIPLVLKSINVEFCKGEITALVGRNGSGKTTMANLITRNYDPSKGRVMVGDRDLVNLEPDFIRKCVGVIPQEPFLLDSFSIRENISFGVTNKKMDKKIWSILDILGIKKEIAALPKQLNSIVGEDVRLSGGQSQLISIARVLMQDRPIIIFDEGTNQLDAEHEARIMDILKRVKEDRVVIMITHRMTTARKADKICVLDRGKIIEIGNHADLLNKPKGIYKKFWNLQIAGE